jgi:flagellar protein FliO/FliZ
MVTQIVGMQQILITVVFLSCLIGLLVFLRMKGGSIRANLQKGQRIKVVEETAVGPAERLRLITIDGRDFLMLSGKGIQPSLLPLSLAAAQIPKLPVETTFAPDIQPSNKLETSKPVADQPPLELTNSAFQLGKQTANSQASQDMDPHQMDPAEVAAFAAKFKGWRKK